MKSTIQWARRLPLCGVVMVLLALNSPRSAASPERRSAPILSGGGTNDWRSRSGFLRDLLLDFQKMWLKMIQWSMGLIPGDASPWPVTEK